MPSQTPAVLFLVFNRPDVTAQVFNAIRQAKPRQLFVAADGPRASRAGEDIACAETRKIIEDGVDWQCEVKTLYRTTNLGCGKAVSQAIHWFFENVEEGIILEDDTLPDPTFFSYCAELLGRYRNDDRVLLINGDNFQFGRKRVSSSYYASRYAHIWGWASWRRAWNLYTFDIQATDEVISNFREYWGFSEVETRIWRSIFERVQTGEVDTWDYQLQYALFKYHKLCLTPGVNLVSNLGFGAGATHTVETHSLMGQQPTEAMPEIIHPEALDIQKVADAFSFYHYFHEENFENIRLVRELTQSTERQQDYISRLERRVKDLEALSNEHTEYAKMLDRNELLEIDLKQYKEHVNALIEYKAHMEKEVERQKVQIQDLLNFKESTQQKNLKRKYWWKRLFR